MATDNMKLAIDGGTPYRTRPFPSYINATGRWLGDEEKKLLLEVIDSGCLGRNGGTKVEQLEGAFAAMYGVPWAQAVTSGTAALHTGLAALNLEPGDEVITTTCTDMGTIIAILANNLVPTFADIDSRTGLISAETIAPQISYKTRAILVVHLWGQPADMDPILALAKKHNLYVVEDCAQAHLAAYKGRIVGTMGDIGCFSFQQSKQMTTGDGGMVITQNEAFGIRARLFADKGWPRGIPGKRGHLILAMNYRLTELQGAVGLAQLAKLPRMVARRRLQCDAMRERLSHIPGIVPPPVSPHVQHAWWHFTFSIDQAILGVTPEVFAKAVRAEGLPFGVGYLPHPIFEYEVIRDRQTFGTSGIPWTLPQARQGITYDRKDYPGTLALSNEVFVTNWNEGMADADVDDIVGALTKVATYYAGRRG
jgi:perosamine synthetase